MKFKYILGTLLVMLCMLSISASATTSNDNLPSENKVTSFVDDVSGDTAEMIYDSFIEKFPEGKCDLWKNDEGDQIVSLYFKDTDSKKGYGSIYLNDKGKKVAPACGDYIIDKKYTGDDDSKEDEKEEVTEKEDTKEEDSEDYLDEEISDMSNKEKIESFMHYYKTLDMTNAQVETCLYYYFGDEDN